MKRIKLSHTEYLIVKEVVLSRKPLFSSALLGTFEVEVGISKHNPVLVELHIYDLLNLIEELSDLLIEKGVTDGEINNFGIEVDALLGRLLIEAQDSGSQSDTIKTQSSGDRADDYGN